MRRQTGLRLDEATLADAHEAARREGVGLNAWITSLVVRELYAGEASEAGPTVDEQQMADLQESFDDHERRLSRLEELAEGQGA